MNRNKKKQIHKIVKIFFFILGIGFPFPLIAQNFSIPHDSTERAKWELNTGRLGLNTLGLQNDFRVKIKTGKNRKLLTPHSSLLTTHPPTLHLGLNNEWLYNESAPGNHFLKKDINSDMMYSIPMNENLMITPHVFWHDYQSSRTNIHGFVTNMSFFTRNRFFINTLRAGYISDQREIINDKGVIYGTDINCRLYGDSLLQTGINFTTFRINIQPRSNIYYKTNFFLKHELNDFSGYEINSGIMRKEGEDYLSNNIQNITSDTIFSGLKFHYKLYKFLVLYGENSLYFPDRKFRYRKFENYTISRQNIFYDESDFNSNEKLVWNSEKIFSELSFLFDHRNRNYGLENNLSKNPFLFEKELKTEKSKDIQEKIYEWRYLLSLSPGNVTRYQLRYIGRLLRMETPGNGNELDRDEVYYLGEAEIRNRWNEFFETFFTFSGSINKHVLIKSENSINNFTQRGLKYEPGYRVKIGNFTWKADYGLIVTYHVKDIETESIKNRSNRLFVTNQLFQFETSPFQFWEFQIKRNENYLSMFNWNNFRESPLDSTISYESSLTWHYRKLGNKRKIEFTTGYRIFYQSKSAIGTLSKPGVQDRIYVNHHTFNQGPVMGINFKYLPQLEISADCWFQFAKIYWTYMEGNQQAIIGSQVYTIDDLSKKAENFYPYFTISSRWYLK